MPTNAAPWGPRLPKPSFRRPARAWALSEWALLPLRLFLGVTFAYAGLQKLANPNFFIASSPISIQNQLAGAARFSPIHSLLHAMLPYAGFIGMVIAYAEIAIGLGTLLGFFSRTAAAGGAVLSFNLFLAISFHASPYFTGADIVFFFAWLPLVIAGGGSQLSLDSYLRRYVRAKHDVPAQELVTVPFDQVQALCGNFSNNTCKALKGAACQAGSCPVLLGDQAPQATEVAIASNERRQVVVGGYGRCLARCQHRGPRQTYWQRPNGLNDVAHDDDYGRERQRWWLVRQGTPLGRRFTGANWLGRHVHHSNHRRPRHHLSHQGRQMAGLRHRVPPRWLHRGLVHGRLAHGLPVPRIAV